LLLTSGIENYLGFESITGAELADKFANQMAQYDIDEIIGEKVVELFKQDDFFKIRTEGDQLHGIICLHDVKAVPREKWSETQVSQVMTPWDRLVTVSVGDNGNTVLSRFGTHDVNQLPVVECRQLMGIVRRSDVISHLQLRSELGS